MEGKAKSAQQTGAVTDDRKNDWKTIERIGFAVKVLGDGGIKECDLRRAQSNPHLRCSLEMMHQVFAYLNKNKLRMYRMSSQLAPYATHPDMPQFHNQLAEAADEIAALGKVAREYDLRLSMHPPQFIVLNALDERIAAQSALDLNMQAELLDRMGLDENAVLVVHVGGAYGDKATGIERFAARFKQLPEATQRRLVVENDDVTYGVADALRVHELCGIRVVFDNLHHFCYNPTESAIGGAGEVETRRTSEQMTMREALSRCLATWPEHQTPKIHYSSPRTESQEQARKTGKAGTMQSYQSAPELRLHSDYINPMEFLFFMQQAAGLRPFDVMTETKAKDLAVLKLRADLAKYGQAFAMP